MTATGDRTVESPGTRPSARPTIEHVPALDGLRGLAVVAVLAFHADHLRGGYLGVDAFFVLSGFLITALLLVEHGGTGRIDLRAFWGRRARRLLPAMFATVAVSSLLVRFVLDPSRHGSFGREALAALAYISNWVSISEQSDYWALFEAPSPLEHLWSLAIEEQFYVVWPLVAAACLALGRGRRRVLAAVSVAGIVASWTALWVHGSGVDGTARAYFGTDTRAAAILLGALVALVVTGRSRAPGRIERTLGVVAIPLAGGVAVAWFTISGTDPWLYRWGLPLHGVAVAALLVAVTGPCAGLVGRVLSVGPLGAIGAVSYGLYLWHWPIYVVLDESRTGLHGWALTGVRVAVSVAATSVSYRLVEEPIRRQRVSFRRPAWVGAGAALATAAMVAVLVVVPANDDDQTAASVLSDASGPILRSAGSDPETTRLLVVGDSGAEALGAELRVRAGDGVVIEPLAEAGCGLARSGAGIVAADGSFFPDPDGCHDWPTRWTDAVERFEPDVSLLVLAWAGTGDRDLGDGVPRGPCDPAFDAFYRSEIDDAVDVLASGGGAVAIATVPPHGFDRSSDERTQCLNRMYSEAADALRDAHLADLARWACDAGDCDGAGDEWRPDGIHFAGAGATAAADWLLGEVDRIHADAARELVALVGDSQAFTLAATAPETDDLGFQVGAIAPLGCGFDASDAIVSGGRVDKSNCREDLARLPERLDELDPDVVVLHAGVWEAHDGVGENGRLDFPSSEWEAHRREAIVRVIENVGTDRQVVVLTMPCIGTGPGAAGIGADVAQRVAAVNRILRAAAASHDARVVDYGRFLCPEGEPVPVGGVIPRPDGIHVEAAGAASVWEWLGPRIAPR
ncbi:MAG: acyltransferase family protein [Acidimicrobiales bacterium]|nr:acyltransferase family protein [Acidimicrobiales bacterium]